MIRQEDVYKIGVIGKTHGVKGELSVQIDDDVFDRVDADYLVLSLDGILVPFFLEEYRFKSDEVALIKFLNIDTQERARELTGTEVFFPRSLAEDGADAPLSKAQIVGFAIVNDGNDKEVGRIAHIDDTTVNTLFELEDGTLIPATDDMVVAIDLDNRIIRMNLPEGLLDL